MNGIFNFSASQIVKSRLPSPHECPYMAQLKLSTGFLAWGNSEMQRIHRHEHSIITHSARITLILRLMASWSFSILLMGWPIRGLALVVSRFNESISSSFVSRWRERNFALSRKPSPFNLPSAPSAIRLRNTRQHVHLDASERLCFFRRLFAHSRR